MRRESTVLLAVVFVIVFAFVVIQVPGAEPAAVQPRVVVAMTSHEIAPPVGPAIPKRFVLHFFRVWSDGYTEWNCRTVFPAGTAAPTPPHQRWSGWKSITDPTAHVCW